MREASYTVTEASGVQRRNIRDSFAPKREVVADAGRRRRQNPPNLEENRRDNIRRRDENLDARAKRAEQLDADVRSADQAYGTARIAFNFSWPTLLASAGLFVTNALSLSPVWSTIFSSMAEPMIAALLVSMPVSLLMVATGALVGLTLYLYIRKRALKKKRNELRAEQDGEYLHLDDVTRGT